MLYHLVILAAVMGQSAPSTQPASETDMPATTLDLTEGLTGGPVDIQITDDGNLIIIGHEQDVALLSQLAQQLDSQPGIVPGFKVFTLKHAQAADLATKLQKFWNEITKPVRARKARPEDKVTIIPEPRSNRLMVAATEMNMTKIAGIINDLDQPTLEPEVKLYEAVRLKHIQATVAEEELKDMFKELLIIRGVKTPLFDIRAEVRTNSLLISASEEDLKQIKHLIELIDVSPTETEGPWGVYKMAVYPLRKASAEKLAGTLQDMIQAPTGDKAKKAKEQIRRLQVLYKDPDGKKDKTLSDLDLDKPIKVFFDKAANVVIVATVEKNLDPIGEIIRLLDTVPVAEDMMVNIFLLKHADAESVQKMLEDMFKQAKDLPKLPGRETDIPDRVPPEIPGSALVHNIAISADIRTNVLVVAGQVEQMALIQKVLEQIDVPEHANRFTPKIVFLLHADVKRVADIADKMAEMWQEQAKRISPLAEDRERVVIIPDVRTNSMIIIANDDNYKEIVNLVDKLDHEVDDLFGQARIVKCNNLMAAELVDKIDKLWERKAKMRKEDELPEDKPVVVPDARTNSLVIASNPEDYEAIKKLVEKLESLELSPMADIRLLGLEHNDAGKVADMIEKLFGERLKNTTVKGDQERPSEKVAIVAEPLTNTMLIASSKTMFDEIERLVKKIDVPLAVEDLIKTYVVKYADVTKTAELLDKLFKEGVYRGATSDKELPKSITQVTIISDLRSSSIIVSASPENIAIVEALLKQIDLEDTPMFKADATFFKLEHADVVKVADMLDQLFEGMRNTIKEEKEQLEITFVPDMRSNILVAAGTSLAMKRTAELIKELDKPPLMPTSIMHVYTLKEAPASQIEPIMTKLFEERTPSDLKDKRTPIVILPDDGSNSLIVTASQEDHKTVETLLKELDRKSTLAQQVAIIPLQQAKAKPLAETLDDLLQQQQKGMEGQEGGFAIAPEERTNSLIVWAAPDLLKNIREIAVELDTNKTTTEMAMRVFTLYNAKAEELSDLLEEFFETAGAGEKDEARQLIIEFTPIDPETGKPVIDPDTGEALIRSLVHQDITIKPDENTNSLYVMTPKDRIDMMEMLIQMLDSVQPLTADVRVFTLTNADATEMKDLLDELFQTEKGGEGEDRRRLIIGGEQAVPGGAEGRAGLDLAFSVDERTNSLIVAGSEAYLKTVETLVLQLDYQEIEERIVKVVPLRHREAEEVAETLSNYFDEEASVIEEVEGEAITRQLERKVTITDGGEGSNTLIMSYSPRMESQVVRLVNELDRLPPSVYIEVLMAEVTVEDRFEMGMEFAIQDLLFSERAFIGANDTLHGDNFDFVFGSDVGAAGGTGLGGFSFSVTGEDFNFLLRALQTEGRLEVVSRPSIYVQDNEDAKINIGERVPVVKDVNIGPTGMVTPGVDYEEVGIILEVTPIISPDGYVKMDIAPEISSIGPSSVPIATGVTLPTFIERKAETSVTVKDGETIIIGGLITDRESTNENKVPLLGDIPYLGNLFRSNVRETTKRELLIILTPHVVMNMEDARTISEDMRDQTGMMDNIRRNPLMNKLQVKPDQEEFSPVEPLRPVGPQKDESGQLEEMGPVLERLGPKTSSIKVVPVQRAIAVRSDRFRRQ